MPIIKINGLLVYYAHVPKCGGSSVEDYLTERFGPLAFMDRRYNGQPVATRWNRSSPQHIPVENLDRLFPEGFFDHVFTVVRHPVDRLRSVFLFQRDVEEKLRPEMQFSGWVRRHLDNPDRKDPFLLDNHIRPMSDIVPQGAKVFKLEEGLDPLVRYLDEIAGNSDGPREIGRANSYSGRMEKKGKSKSDPITPKGVDLRALARIYEADFQRFGYSIKRETA